MAESIKLNGDKYIDAEGVYDHTLGKPLSQCGPHIYGIGKVVSWYDNEVLNWWLQQGDTNYIPQCAKINVGGPEIGLIWTKHSNSVGGSVIVFSYQTPRPVFYQFSNSQIVTEYYL